MSSSTSLYVSSMPYDPVRSVDKPSTTYPNSALFDPNTSVMAEFSRTALYGIINRENLAEQARRQAMMVQMDWSSRPAVSSTHQQAEPEIQVKGALDCILNYTRNLVNENVPHHLHNYANGDPLYDQKNVPSPPDAINYMHGLPIEDVYDDGFAPIPSLHDRVDYHPYGSIIIPRQIPPLQESMLNSAPTVFPPSIQSEAHYPQEYVYGANSPWGQHGLPDVTFPPYQQAENHYPIPEPQSYSEMVQGVQWEGGNELLHVPQEIVRQESPEIKIEPVDDEENIYSYSYFHSSAYTPEPQAMEICESIERDDVEERYPLEPLEHTKLERAEDSDSFAYSTTGTFASTNSHASTSSSMTSYYADALDHSL
ncbi:hypothetical protein FHL15_002009 [Xylaria flabelliformis]|uniref:Uncharacterized protein n=1 Tax=Xylaria flabelliformis TaxID=2512241 RepID=A0A553IAI4_9PEZI|nr:hypothetical protein FHL15_002009 [Xylaria flabelliformis]